MRGLLGEIGVLLEGPTIIYEDNQSCIAFSESPAGTVKLVYVQSSIQRADMLTKPLPRQAFERCLDLTFHRVLGTGGVMKVSQHPFPGRGSSKLPRTLIDWVINNHPINERVPAKEQFLPFYQHSLFHSSSFLKVSNSLSPLSLSVIT